jgi:predicted transcriptional regulator of viral defense system
LKGAGGATLVPYEYCSAKSFLEMANLEANENDWKQARDFANRSKSAAEAGLSEVRKKK